MAARGSAVTLGAGRAGEALAMAASELARIWRSARAEARPGVFPGLADGLVASFVTVAGEALVRGTAPEDVYPRLEGVVRLDPARIGRAEEELRAEWRLLGEVLAAACDALEAGPDATDRVARAVEHSRRALERVREGPLPAGVLRVYVLSALRTRSAGRR